MSYNELVINEIKRLKLKDVLKNEDIKDVEVRLDDYLLNKSKITEDEYVLINSNLFKLPYKKREGYLEEISFPRLFSDEIMQKNGFLLSEKTKKYEVLITDGFINNLMMLMNMVIPRSYTFVLVTKTEMKRLREIASSSSYQKETYQIEITPNESLQDSSFEINNEVLNNYPIVKLFDKIVEEGLTIGASDIHFEPQVVKVIIKMRLDGQLYERSSFDIRIYQEVITRIKIMADLDITQKLLPQDGKIKKTFQGKSFDLRISTLPTVYGERVSIRILDPSRGLRPLKELGLLNYENKMIIDLLNSQHGIILVCGPTGCGKSTTLYTFINELLQKDLNIITVEDPVEYTIKGLNQVQVNPKAGLTFASCLRSILRQDPNVIMIGEIRDETTAEIATRSAITGHLVLSTLHTNDSVGAINRLIDMHVPPYLVSEAILGVISQRLVRKLCNKCKAKVKLDETKITNDLLGLNAIYQPVGCSFCNQTGYLGRIGVYEIIINDEKVKQMITMQAKNSDIMDYLFNKSFHSLKANAKVLLESGIIGYEDYHKL